ncbi:AAA family ATPase [Candidatus Micrarchaeota archaeon]|nr:AAA family ATPase [Candidatus Micrarchaeota archaeon]
MKVIGLTGTLSCGKGAVAAILNEAFGARVLVFSDVLREQLKLEGKPITRNSLHVLANDWRKKFGPGIIAKKLIELINADGKNKLFACDGFRTVGEVNEFKSAFGEDFVLIAVDAPVEKRFELSKKRAREAPPKTLEEFVESERAETKPNAKGFDQNLPACIKLSQYNIYNDGSIEGLRKKTMELAKKMVENN